MKKAANEAGMVNGQTPVSKSTTATCWLSTKQATSWAKVVVAANNALAAAKIVDTFIIIIISWIW